MFTGIVQSLGQIAATHPRSGGLRLMIHADSLDVRDVVVGDSIAINGCCLTVVTIDGSVLGFDASSETLQCTTGLDRIGAVNLELALRMGDRLGGHLVSGHVDGVGSVVGIEPVAGDAESTRLEIAAPDDLARFIAPKGSITVDGVSLTVNLVAGRRFSMNLIPHTLAVTTLRNLVRGSNVNLEVDIVARYVARLHEASHETSSRQEQSWT